VTEQPQPKECLGRYQEDPDICHDCPIWRICEVVTADFARRSIVIDLIEDIRAEIEA